MVEMYIRLINAGLRTIEQVPERYREEVRQLTESTMWCSAFFLFITYGNLIFDFTPTEEEQRRASVEERLTDVEMALASLMVV